MPSTANISHDFTGFFLIGGHAVVFSYFLTSTVLFSLVKGVEPFCWPFFENCGQYRLESPGELRIVSLAYLALILLALYTRLYRRSLFTIAIAAVNVFLIGIVSLIIACAPMNFTCCSG